MPSTNISSWLPKRIWLVVSLALLAGAELFAVYLALIGVLGHNANAFLNPLLLGLSLLNLLIVVALTLGNAGLHGRTASVHLAEETPPDDEVRQRLELLQRTLDGLASQSHVQAPSLVETFRQSTIAMCLSRAEDGRIVEINPAFTVLTGCKAAALAGRTDFPLCPQPHADAEAHAPQEPVEFFTAANERRQAVIARTALRLHGDMHLLTLAVDVTPWLRSREALAEFETRYREMFRRTRAVMLLVDAASGQILEANPAAVSFYGHPPQTLRKMRLQELTEDIADESLEGEQPLRLIQHSADGQRHAVEVYRAQITLRGRRLDYLIVQDITSRVRAQTALKHSKAQIRSTLEAIPDAVIRFTSQGRIEFLNSAAQRILGNAPAAELIGRAITETLSLSQEDSDDPVDLEEIIVRAEAGEEVRFIARLDSEQRGEIITQANCTRIAGEEEHQPAFVLVLHDVTQLRALSRKLSYQAAHDALTGLINRREFERQVSELIRETQTDGSVHMLCYIDLDQFKLVNDTSGHRAGDALLGQVSNLLTHGVRRSDIVARLGGDEFGILLSHCERPVAEDIAGKLIESISAHRFTWEDRTFRIGASIGMVILNAETSDLQEAMSAADAACYLAKERGRNRYIVHAGAEDTVMQRRQEMEWVRLLHGAMENESFQLHYQNIESSSATPDTSLRIELLLRLSQPDGLLVRPERFMPAAERFGLMPELDLWVVRQVCERLADYMRRYPLSVYINLAAQSLADVGLGERIADLLEEYNVPAQRIYFDIQELAAAASLPQARLINQTLRAQGCRFSIDHYGASQPAFAHLNGLSFDQVKIDGKLIAAMANSNEARSNVVNINNICHGLGLQTVATCVETPQLLHAAEHEGIDFMEGHSIGGGVKPLSWLESELRQRFDAPQNDGAATSGRDTASRG
jgi:Amt family ammonium transporter